MPPVPEVSCHTSWNIQLKYRLSNPLQFRSWIGVFLCNCISHEKKKQQIAVHSGGRIGWVDWLLIALMLNRISMSYLSLRKNRRPKAISIVKTKISNDNFVRMSRQWVRKIYPPYSQVGWNSLHFCITWSKTNKDTEHLKSNIVTTSFPFRLGYFSKLIVMDRTIPNTQHPEEYINT